MVFGVNALKGATFISTMEKLVGINGATVMCQCPEWGDLHFHEPERWHDDDDDDECQCPEWGDLHFHTNSFRAQTRVRRRVNALNGATFISTYRRNLMGTADVVSCQCPEWGDLHFHDGPRRTINISVICVNALNGATFISTWRTLLQESKISTLCQCPEWGDLHFHSRIQRKAG